MNNYAVISLFPEMFTALSESGITSRVIAKKLASISFFNPRDYTQDSYQSVDDAPFGGGPGMVMKPEPLYLAHCAAKAKLSGKKIKTIYFAPQGEVLTQKKAAEFALSENMILVCGRYEGVDQRFIDLCVDEVVCVGDYIVSGGELPAMTLLDAMFRLLPGSIKEHSHQEESFSEHLQGLLEAQQYTRPANWRGHLAPDVLLSGNHKEIEQWRKLNSLEVTAKYRDDLL